MWAVDSTSTLQDDKGWIQYEKLRLNLRSLRWLNPTSNLVSSFEPTGLCMLKYELATGWLNFSRVFLKDNKLLALRIFKSILLHSKIVYGKNKYLKTSVLQWYAFRLPSFNRLL